MNIDEPKLQDLFKHALIETREGFKKVSNFKMHDFFIYDSNRKCFLKGSELFNFTNSTLQQKREKISTDFSKFRN